MGYDFAPRKKEVPGFYMGAFSWPVLLSHCGHAIGYCEGIRPGTYYFRPDKKGYSPCNNDGYQISSKDAKELAKRIREFLDSNKTLRKEWDGYDEQTQKQMQQAHEKEKLYNIPILNDELLAKWEAFADFAEKSGGFRIL
jgi:hypothetical protein